MSTERQIIDRIAELARRVEEDRRRLEETISAAYQAGVPSKSIARVLGVTPSRVRQIAGPRLHVESLVDPAEDDIEALS